MLVVLMAVANVGYAQSDHGFRFVRIKFEDERSGFRGRGGAAWSHDHPTAEYNFYEALKRTTEIPVEGPPLVLTLGDDRIFEYPVLYLCEPGYWSMGEEEADNLRAYLERGGFILFDDFRGQREWAHFYRQMKRIFPEREMMELPTDHAIWHVYYDVDPEAAPSLVSGRRFMSYEDRYFAIFDDNGRMMALACYNQDIGDGWEWPGRNIADASTITFQMGINFVVYALTH